jgi:hypothetical protein
MTTEQLRTLLIAICIVTGSAILMGSVLAEILGLAFPLVAMLACAGFSISVAAILHFDKDDI